MKNLQQIVFASAFVVLCVPLFAFSQATSTATTTEIQITASTTPTVATSTPVVNTNEGIETKVRAQFADAPAMIEIARCESSFKQFDNTGNPLDGGAGSMIGVFQINASVHRDFAQSLTMDINSVEGNLAYARYLYSSSGTDPWISSIGCWNPVPVSEQASDTPVILTTNLSFGMVHPEVLLLQKLLNKTASPVANDGPGSPGQETTKFGALTRVAVRNFQCAKNIVCDGDEYATGYGFVGPRTRIALGDASGTPASGGPGVSAEAAEIARLQALIVELSKQLAALQQKSRN